MSTWTGLGRDQRGFSLTELMVSVAVLGLVMAAIVNVHMTGNTVVLTGENKAEAQQGARAILQMEEDLRLAGYGYPPGQPAFVSASPTAVSVWADVANASTTLSSAVTAGATTLSVVNGSGIQVGDTVYLISGGQWESRLVSSAGAPTVTVSIPATSSYQVGAQVGRPRTITYSWNGLGTLLKNAGDGTGPQQFATGVQTLQLTYFDPSDTPIPPGTLAANLGNIRRVAITMTVRSASPQNPGSFTLTSSVRPRNL